MSQPDNAPRGLFVLTGASRGVGHALADQLLARGEQVLTLQRHPAPLPAAAQGRLEAWACDLAEPAPVANRLQDWLSARAGGPWRDVTLINNAALLTEPGPLADLAADDAARALRVGLEAPLLLSAAFLRATAGWTVPRRLLHISSGLGRRAMAGSSVYCAAKAGLDHLSRVIALEEAESPQGARSVSIAPGVIDTDMQRQLRGADPTRFEAQSQFQALKDQGRLDTPEGCAAKLLAYLDRPDFGATPVADIRDAA